jgi:molybdopterin/thiamine biosynthesis adenylyltransferase
MSLPTWKPTILAYSEFENWPDHVKVIYDQCEIHDQYEHQVKEFLEIQSLGTNTSEQELNESIETMMNTSHGNVVIFPWLKKAVRILDEEGFVTVRTNRSRNKITAQEHQVLSAKKIGVIGMSVGRAVATTMALERIFGEMRMADFDTLDLSNLNRLKAPIYDLGLPKVCSVAREILSIDPYLKLTLYDQGATNENLEQFLTVGGRLDLLVDECDSLEIKIRVRQWAKKMQIPVVMETSDRGMLDVERFDLEPNRSIFHGLLDEFDIEEALKDPNLKWEMLLKLVQFENLSDRAKASMAEIGKTLKTWPQLASAVMLGGGTVTDVSRRILLNEEVVSGRYYFDIDKVIN